MFAAEDQRQDSLTVQPVQLEMWAGAQHTVKMLVSGARLAVGAPQGISDSKEAAPTMDVLKYASLISGAQYVMMTGDFLMLKWSADS